MSPIFTRNSGRRAFTLIELLVTILILAILMSVALPQYLSAARDSERKTCRANLKTISNAVQASRVKDAAADYSAYIGAVSITILPDLTSVPYCPAGGAYSVGVGSSGDSHTYLAECTVSAHGSYEPGVDSE